MHTDAINFQLGAFICQEEKPIYFYSIKLTRYLKSHMVTSKELQSIVRILNSFGLYC